MYFKNTKIQDQLRILHAELGKGKSSAKAQSALDELHYLTSFNQNVSFAMGKLLQHLSDFTFTQMANLTLVRRDSYLEHLKQGVKPDTFSALRNCPLNRYALFPDTVIRKAEDEIANMKMLSVPPSPLQAMWGSQGGTKKVRIGINHTPLLGKVRIRLKPLATLVKTCRPGKPLAGTADQEVGGAEDHLAAAPEAPRMSISINDNYCVTDPVLTTRSANAVYPLTKTETQKTVNFQTNVNYSVTGHVPFATKIVRQPQKKGLSPPLKKKVEIKSVNCVSFVVQRVSAPSVPNAHSVVHAPLVGGCLQPFWQTWARLGVNPRVVSILKEVYVLPFKLKLPLVRHTPRETSPSGRRYKPFCTRKR